MRKQINGLVLLVQEEMRTSPFETALFVFCNAQRQLLKAVYWDRMSKDSSLFRCRATGGW